MTNLNTETDIDNITIEDLHGRNMGGGLKTAGPRSITIILSEDEFKRIGGTEADLQRLSRKLSDFTNDYIRDI